MKKIYLVDVSSMFFRAFYAIRSLTNQSGMPTNAVYGLLSMTVKLMREKKPDYMAFCYDLPTPSFRKDIDPRYKATRTEMPAELIPQIPYIKQLALALGIPCFEKFGYEADDLIGTITKWARSENIAVEIVSGDKDFCQLVEPHVAIYDTMKEFHFDDAAVVSKWGVPPRKFVDYLAIVGDSSDNIKGVAGIGPKGAEKLLTQFESLEEIYQNLDAIANKNIREKLIAAKDEAFLSKRLVQIVLDIPLDLSRENLSLKPIERETLRRLLLELDFKSYVKTLLGESLTAPPAVPISDDVAAVVAKAPADSPPAVKNWAPAAEVSDTFGHLNLKLQRLEIAELEQFLKPNFETWAFKNERGIYLVQGQEIVELAGDPKRLGEMLTAKNLKWKGGDLKNFFKQLFIFSPNVVWDQLLAAYVVRAGPV